jgi:hypothetical protein
MTVDHLLRFLLRVIAGRSDVVRGRGDRLWRNLISILGDRRSPEPVAADNVALFSAENDMTELVAGSIEHVTCQSGAASGPSFFNL